jgi:hypothetical protein
VMDSPSVGTRISALIVAYSHPIVILCCHRPRKRTIQ